MSKANRTQDTGTEVIGGLPVVICSEALRQVLHLARRVGQTNASVLITGESGVGKELVARAIHDYSLRCSMPWVDVNCGALPENLIESELFGYEKGAFSGADQSKKGLFELAHTGTLFLDEIGELDSRAQVKLLRVLDGVPYFRLGGTKKISVDTRIVAASNRNLEEAIGEGKFRSDLFHRLSQVQIHVPPLRERPEDIIPLAEFFAHQHDPSLRLAADTQEVLRQYQWPGNVRELRNAVMRAAILAAGEEIRPGDLPGEMGGGTSLLEPTVSLTSLEEMQRRMILRVLDQTGGHHKKAAELLGISPRTLTRKLKSYGVRDAQETLVPC